MNRTVLSAVKVAFLSAVATAPAFAAGGGHGDDHGVPWMSIGLHAINFGILLFVLVKFGGPAIKDSLHGRALTIKRDIQEAAVLKQEAQARHDELSARLDKVAGELESIRHQAEIDGANEEQRMRASAEAAAVRIAETAQRQIADETARARQAIREETVAQAVELAESILRNNVNTDDQKRLAGEFLASVGKVG